MTTTAKITFSKFEGTGHRDDDTEATVYADGVAIGTVEAVRSNVGSWHVQRYVVTEYIFERYADGSQLAQEVRRYSVVGDRWVDVQSPAAARSALKRQIANL
jgi:hypothetical protein